MSIKNLVTKNTSGELLTTSKVLADGIGIEHRTIKETIEKHRDKVKSIAKLDFYTEVQKVGRPVKHYVLSEQQAMFVINLSNNTAKVSQFKLELTNAFFEMQKQLQTRQLQLPKNYKEALLALVAKEEEKEILLLQNTKQEQKISELRKYELFYKDLLGSIGLLTIGTASKSLMFKDKVGKNVGQNKLFEFLKDKDILMKNRDPYQKYVNAGYFEVEIKPARTATGSRVGRKTQMTIKGLAYVHKLLLKHGYTCARQTTMNFKGF